MKKKVLYPNIFENRKFYDYLIYSVSIEKNKTKFKKL